MRRNETLRSKSFTCYDGDTYVPCVCPGTVLLCDYVLRLVEEPKNPFLNRAGSYSLLRPGLPNGITVTPATSSKSRSDLHQASVRQLAILARISQLQR